ncbi:5-dehydro-2-deoxygluconokinase [Zhongshania aliphaticivorans]|uniref:5-dehydro-2-deoxygluconokinase n=1 Tax=Zhongshania aliphaticivorans TaxID=1470434 RepID=A0A5S9NQ18_9GAMM|nr:adenosine kinase [Zhongshania aliphaticivorans]CAA0092428.1 5-dehydro-2-deoxygluconokinase [Zhongshania aliphaticivorans]CAA0109712.1 5-dehydro-2-deoxygluconokinase [Zhongshania aliphaticivorans]
MKTYHLYGIGAALVDTEIEINDQELNALGVEKGLMTLVDADRQQELMDKLSGHLVHASQASGGSACNSVIAAAYFGANNYYSCKVANDEHGDFFMNDIKSAGVDADFSSEKSPGVTGKCLVLISPDAERSMNTNLGISETLSVSELNESALSQSQYFYAEGYLVTSDTGRAAAIAGRKIAENNEVKTALSFSDPGMVSFFRDGLSEMLGDGVDLIFCNEAEALGWAQSENIDDAISALKKISKTFAITLGAKGALVFDGEQLHTIAGHKVNAVDTNGAGDMFAGAFLYAITHGYDFQQAGNLASLAAAEVVSQYGPRLAGPRHQELLAQLA